MSGRALFKTIPQAVDRPVDANIGIKAIKPQPPHLPAHKEGHRLDVQLPGGNQVARAVRRRLL
jgi:hypothetical protein